MITQNIIGFQLSSGSGRFIQAVDAATLEMLPEQFVVATPEDVDLALQKAVQAWRIYRHIPGERKAGFLEQIATGIEALDSTLVERIMRETAYPEARVITERNRTCAQLRMFAKEAIQGSWLTPVVDEALPERSPLPRPLLERKMMPIGPVVVFGASNFPLAYSTAGGDVASALAAGCPVIVKAHESHLGTHSLVAEVIMQAARATGMPDGVFSALYGDGLSTGKLLVTHPMTAAVGFTGSRQGGRALFDLGQQRPKPIPVFAEMGSVNPMFLLPGKVAENPKGLAAQLASSMSMTAGQFCTQPGVMAAVDNKQTEMLINCLTEALENMPASHMLNPSIRESFRRGVSAIRIQEGVSFERKEVEPENAKVTPVLATVPAEVFLTHPHLHEEVFGPFSIVVLCKDFAEMKQVAEIMEGQLTASIHATAGEAALAWTLVDILSEKAGRLILNGVPTGVEVCAAMTHGGPYPASTDARFTAVGAHAIWRWLRPVTFQNFTDIGSHFTTDNP